MTDVLQQPLRLPCGVTLPNRLCKAAMTEGLADPRLRATAGHERLYRLWSEGGAGLLLTGNVQIDRFVLERPGNVAIDLSDPQSSDAEARARLSRWAKAGTVAGNQLWMQISHAGRQSPMYVTRRPVAPSPVKLDLLGSFARPRALTEAEILDFIRRFAHAATVARDCGFTGVQIHGAHGYLISSFLSPVTNQRQDAWGGSLENRARMLLETVRAVRTAVGNDFPVSVKLNSDDFRKGGFSNTECLQVVEWLNHERLDLLEISGGSYEQPVLVGVSGDAATAEAAPPQRESTRRREAYFLDYAQRLRPVAKMPMMITGGFRSRSAMVEAVQAGDCEVIGIGRPLCGEPDVIRRLLGGRLERLPSFEQGLVIRPQGFFSPTSSSTTLKFVNAFGAQGWYYRQILRLAAGQPVEFGRGVISSFFLYLYNEVRTALRLQRRPAG
ncbi:MAG TPA: NADH:flavin oxidoreductase/NADH oxidase family protein [Nevskiaceae bacterium]|nr:NADH:flavin oxidoreductase/NADH oxidase family protein [Nevskiaceae bacterium]